MDNKAKRLCRGSGEESNSREPQGGKQEHLRWQDAAASVASASAPLDSGLWFHRLGPNPENHRPSAILAELAQKPATTPLDLSKLGQDGHRQVLSVQKPLAEHLMSASNRQLLTELSGASVSWDRRSGQVVLEGSAVQVNDGKKLLARAIMHCQWGVSEDKVRRLLNPKLMEAVVVRLSPMGIKLKSLEKALSSRSTTLSIGKDMSNDLIIKDELVSRQHCVLELDSKRGAVYAVDFSSNGTFLNGNRLPQKKHGKVLLSHGDELLLKDPARDAEYGYIVNLVDGAAHIGRKEQEADSFSISRELVETLRQRRSLVSGVL